MSKWKHTAVVYWGLPYTSWAALTATTHLCHANIVD